MNMKIKIEQEPGAWHNLSMRDRAKYIHNSVKNHFVNGGSMTDISIDDIRHQFNDGGTKNKFQYRADWYAKHPEVIDYINQVADIYNINPVLLADRMAHEGAIDSTYKVLKDIKGNGDGSYLGSIEAAKDYKKQIIDIKNQLKTDPTNSYLLSELDFCQGMYQRCLNNIDFGKQWLDYDKGNTSWLDLESNGFWDFGLDTVADRINSGQIQLLNNESWEDTYEVNEKHEKVHAANGITNRDSIGIQAAMLKAMRESAQKDNPNADDETLDRMAMVYYNRGEGGARSYLRNHPNNFGYNFNPGIVDLFQRQSIQPIDLSNIRTVEQNVQENPNYLNTIFNQSSNKNTLLPQFNNESNLFQKGGPKETLEENSPADLMRNDNIGFQQGYYPKVDIPKQSLYEAADNLGITLVPYLGDAVDAMQAANLAKEGKYAEAAILGSTLLIPNILEKPLKFLGKNVLRYFGQGIETIEDLRKLSDDDWYDAYRNALNNDNKESAQNIQQLRVLLKKESGQEVAPFKTNLENQYILKPSFIRDDKTYKNLFWNWNQDRDYFYKKYRTTIGDLRKRYDNLKVQDGKRGQKLLEDIDTNKAILKQEIDQAVKEGKIPETFLEDLEFYTMDTYGRIPEYDVDKHCILAPWKNEQKLTITTDPQTGQQIYDQLPIHQDSKYRYVGKDAYEDYVSRGIVSNIDDEGKALTRHSFPMFTSRNPSSYGFDNNKIWLVSKPDAPLEWESVIGAAITPVYKGETNKTPLSMFDVFQESSEGFRKLQSFGGPLSHQFNTGGNILMNEAQSKNDWRKDSSNKQAYIKDLDEWIAKNPTFKGSNGTIYNTADFRDMFIQLVGHESSYNPNTSSGSYTGYYQIHKNENPNLNQHTRAFKHIDRLFQDNITDYDLKRAKELGINQAALLMKYWNQGNHVNNYLHNGIDHEDGVGTKISLYGNDMDADFDMTNYVSKAITDNYALVPKGGNLWNIAKLARNKNITNYADQKNLITAYNQERNTSFDSKKLQVGDTIWLIPTNISEKPIQKIKTQETSQIDSKVNYDNPQGLPWYNVLLDNIKRTFGWEPPEGRYDFAKGGYLNNRYRRY